MTVSLGMKPINTITVIAQHLIQAHTDKKTIFQNPYSCNKMALGRGSLIDK